VIEAFGPADEAETACDQAWTRFETVLEELVGELAALRSPVPGPQVRGATARRMVAACAPHASLFVTPMAAVAGAVADEVLAAMVAGRALDRAYVNDGGDIALHLSPGYSFDTGLVTLAERPRGDGVARIGWSSPVRGIASSGWRGRSLSLGIADSVTVLASCAAAADAAATLIANAVDVDDPAVRRLPACELDPDSDLGQRPVTVEVGALPRDKVQLALARGAASAEAMRRKGLIVEALLVLQGEARAVGDVLRSVA